jgi:hypothetical protein
MFFNFLTWSTNPTTECKTIYKCMKNIENSENSENSETYREKRMLNNSATQVTLTLYYLSYPD